MNHSVRPIKIALDAGSEVSGLLNSPAKPRAAYLLAHGAGAGMNHVFMAAVADGLCSRGVATLRFQFPYMERGSKRPDSPQVCHAAVRAAADVACHHFADLPLFAGGRSFGGRMASQAQASSPLPGVRGLIFLGFPLHPAKKPSVGRAEHLREVRVPMLFLQGTRDELADLTLLEPVVERLGPLAKLERIEAADHSFHVLARSGRNDADVLNRMLDSLSSWVSVHS
jgi:predicted alpha/beta-hydrolase family hydrolase